MARTFFDRVWIGFSRNDCADFDEVHALQAAIRSGNERRQGTAIKCLYSRFEALAREEAWREAKKRNAKPRPEAFDALQEVLMDFYTRMRDGKLDLRTYGDLDRYGRMALRNQIYKLWRNDLRTQPFDDLQAADQPTEAELLDLEGAALRIHEKRLVALALEASTEECRKKILLWQQNKSYEEIAEVLGINPNSAKNAVYRCLERLRVLFKEKSVPRLG